VSVMNHHIILLSIDALRRDRLGLQRNQRSLTKNMDWLAKESVRLNATTPATWTLPAHMSMLSGLEPLVHGCVSARRCYPPETLPFPLLFELLADKGYVPLSVTGGGYMESQFGFGRGVEDVHLIRPVAEAAQVVLDQLSSHPRTFCFFHTYTVHDFSRIVTRENALELVKVRDPSYKGFFPVDKDMHNLVTALGTTADIPEISPRDVAYLTDIYDVTVDTVDRAIGGLLLALKNRGLFDDTTILITSDHGENLGESHLGRQYFHHGGPPYEELVRIPMLLKPAAAFSSLVEPGEVQETVSLVDIAPTLLDLAEVDFRRDQFDGLSLVDLFQGQVSAFETRRLFFHSCEDTEDRYLDPRLFSSAMTWKDGGKVHYDPRSRAIKEVYFLPKDPHETRNALDGVDQNELRKIDELIAAYHQGIEARARRPASKIIDDPLVLERLAALGYIDV
jgi:arylsulfatase A-like enzyme